MLTSTRFATLLAAAVTLALASWQASAAPLLNGVAVHTELGDEQFIAGLYVDSPSASASQILSADENKRIQVRVLAEDLSSRRFKRMWIEGMAINSSREDLQKNAQKMADFSNMLRIKLIAGDILTVDRSMNDGVTVSLNGTTLGKIEDRTFFDLLLRTWIGSVPLSSGFRSNLLGNGEVPSDLLARYQSTRPTDARIATIESAIAASKQEKVAEREQSRTVAVNTPPPKDLIEAPKLEAPTLAAIPPPVAPKPAPKVSAPDKPKKVATAKPKPAPKADIFEDEDEEAFTAASLLSRQLYIGKVKSWAQRELSYPARALRREWEGNVRLDITLDRRGDLLSVELAEEAEHDVLNKEALRAVEDAAPFPPMPDDVKGDTFLFTLPVAFKLQ